MDKKREVARHPDDKPLEGSLGDYKEFKRSICWKDIENWINERLEMIREALETAENMEEVRGYQESIKQLKDVRDIPDMFIEELKLEQELNLEKDERSEKSN